MSADCDWMPPRMYRFISAWDSLWHVNLRLQRALMLMLLQALEIGGVFLFTAGGLDGPSEHVDATMGRSSITQPWVSLVCLRS